MREIHLVNKIPSQKDKINAATYTHDIFVIINWFINE